jgi:hypothetical protein
MQITRRQLLHRSALAAGALSLPTIPGLAAELAPAADDNLFSRMTWFNEPASSKINDGELTVRSKPSRNS